MSGQTKEPEWPPQKGSWQIDEDRRRRVELFSRLLQEWKHSGEQRPEDVRGYVEKHFRASLPREWVANYRVAREAQHLPNAELQPFHYEWKIFRRGEPDGDREYYVAYLNARNQLVLVFGNSDAGAGGPHHFWEQSINIPLMNLGLVLPFVFSRPHEFSPNRFGLS